VKIFSLTLCFFIQIHVFLKKDKLFLYLVPICEVSLLPGLLGWTLLQVTERPHTVKKIFDFPGTRQDITNQTLPGLE
jgi:hypothetical protein